ncbi:MAG: hypothetical protein WC619_00160 [Patescibacteria group bacterium]
MKAAKFPSIIVVIIAVFFTATVQPESLNAQAESLNVVIKGLNSDETYLVTSVLKSHKLPISTPVVIEKRVIRADWNGKQKEFDLIKVTIQTKVGKFVGNVDSRNYPQIPGEEYYGLLQLALTYACVGPERARLEAKLDAVFSKISEKVAREAKDRGYSVVFQKRNCGTAEVMFTVNGIWCKVDYWPEGNKPPAYSMVRNNTIEPVAGLDAIFASIPK